MHTIQLKMYKAVRSQSRTPSLIFRDIHYALLTLLQQYSKLFLLHKLSVAICLTVACFKSSYSYQWSTTKQCHRWPGHAAGLGGQSVR